MATDEKPAPFAALHEVIDYEFGGGLHASLAALSGVVHGVAYRLQRRAEEYFQKGRLAGLNEERLTEILAEENERAQTSATINAFDAIVNAEHRALQEALEK